MKINRKGLLKSAFLVTLCLSIFSCKDTFDISPEDALEKSKAYQNVFDADAAIAGIYGKFISLADRYMVLNELRADLEDVTPNADKYLREVNDHNVSVDNPWANPKPFYEIILNCNDVIKNFGIMLANKRLSQNDYNIRVSDVTAMRTFIYLQLGIHYGQVPYVTDAFETIEDARDESKFPKITFDKLLTNLIATMEAVPSKGYIPSGNSLLNIFTADGYTSGGGIPGHGFIDKNTLLGDLYLWNGNYPMAAKYLKKVLEYAELTDVPGAGNWYGINTLGENPYPTVSGSHNSGNLWYTIFANGYTERYSNWDNLWMLPFDSKFTPVNPLIALYAPDADKYKIKPSTISMQNFAKQTRNDGPIVAPDLRPTTGTPGDTFRGVGNSYKITPVPYLYKIVPNYVSTNPFGTTGKWIIYRAPEIHLHYSQAANRDGRDRLAYALLNLGVSRTYTPRVLNGTKLTPASPTNQTATPALNFSTIMQSNWYMDASNNKVDETNTDYYFDARNGGTPTYNGVKWNFSFGIRGRVSLVEARVDSAKFFDMSNRGAEYKPVTDRKGLTLAMEDLLVDEGALEMAYEGVRWQDLLMIALRREKDAPGAGKAFLLSKISAKFTAAGLPIPAGVTKLGTDINSWYLPFKL